MTKPGRAASDDNARSAPAALPATLLRRRRSPAAPAPTHLTDHCSDTDQSCDRTNIDSRPGNDESRRETTCQMRLRFVAIPFRRARMIKTITTNRTPEITRIVVGSIEARSLYARAPVSVSCLPHHRSTWGRNRENVSSGFRIMFRLELPAIDNLSATRLPSVNAPAPEPPLMVRQVVFVPQVAPLPA